MVWCACVCACMYREVQAPSLCTVGLEVLNCTYCTMTQGTAPRKHQAQNSAPALSLSAHCFQPQGVTSGALPAITTLKMLNIIWLWRSCCLFALHRVGQGLQSLA